MVIKRILVPIDFSAGALKALDYAGTLATQCDAELLLLHVVAPIYVADPDLASPDVTLLLDEQRRIAATHLARIGAKLGRQGQRCRTLVTYGAPAPVVVSTARTLRADVIVMGTHGRSGLAHLLIGSVAEKVVRTAHCPVLTVRGGARTVKRAARPRNYKR